MSEGKVSVKVDELFELLKRTSLPTVLVEGKDDVIFYREIEHSLSDYGVDILPAGNKDSVIKIYEKIKKNPIDACVVFVVDNDLWVYDQLAIDSEFSDIIKTNGYSIENDLYVDGNLEELLSSNEKIKYREELEKFVKWYALAIYRNLNDPTGEFRTHPNKILDDGGYYEQEMRLEESEIYPDDFFEKIMSDYHLLVRGKSIYALILRQLSHSKRSVKFSARQLMAIGASRKGENYERMYTYIKKALLLEMSKRQVEN